MLFVCYVKNQNRACVYILFPICLHAILDLCNITSL